ncbi:InlB B-repeat-containing protein [Desulfonema magnum]|uniref:Dockerin domain-containing protein n=1 Tax=Desulfonema magnum TaxID=45655 RepID=A0A975GSA4_9BACT|nr:cohesin domain-containing protein [Desulfonema magnum]QTA91707.1 dockerin domain-containing protein [Desulfonema magnum]
MKKLFVYLMVIIISVLSWSDMTHAVEVKISPKFIEPPASGETGTFEVVIENVTKLGGFQFDLNYDDAIVTVEDVVLGDFLGSTGRRIWDPVFKTIDNDHGTLTFGAFSLPPGEGASGNGPLAIITFSLKSEEHALLTFDNTKSWIINTDNPPFVFPTEWISGKITPTCDIAVTSGSHGSITPSGAVVPVEEGTDQRFDIVPDDCYQISDVRADSVSLGAVSSHTFENVTCETENHTLEADFVIRQFTVTPQVSGAGGSISPASPVTVNCGQSRTFTITPDTTAPDCYYISNVKVNNASVGAVSSYTLENIRNNYTIAASFAINNYSITPSVAPADGRGGSISPAEPVTLVCGSQRFDITPDTANGYQLSDVLVDGVSVGGPVSSYTFTANNLTGASHTIHAIFVADYHTIEASAGDTGSINPSGSVKVAPGDDKTFEIIPAECYKVKDVIVDDESKGAINAYTFEKVTANHTIHATFEKIMYTIEASADEGGNISPSGTVEVECGADQAFTTEITDDCYEFKELVTDNETELTDNTFTFTDVQSNHIIRAVFEKKTYIIAASAGKNGTIEPSGDVVVNCGENQIFQITPKDEAHPLLEVRVNGKDLQEVTDEYIFEDVRAENHRIHAIFEGDDIHTITGAVAGAGGSIEPAGDVIVIDREDQKFTIIPDEGRSLIDVLINGVSVGAKTEYTFSNVTADHTILAVFETHAIETIAGDNGKIEPIGDVTIKDGKIIVPHGLNQSFTITPDACYEIEAVQVGSVTEDIEPDESGQGVYEFKEIIQDSSITAAFKRITDKGDINNNGTADLADAILTLKLLSGTVFITLSGADTDGDGKAEMEDAVYTLQVVSDSAKPQTGDESVVFGDINDDGTVDLRDTILTLKLVRGADVSTEKITICADANQDDKIGAEEVIYVLGIIAEMITP